MIDFEHITRELQISLSVIKELCFNKPETFYTWKPSREKWNLLEILCHLRDEEVEDFRIRTQYALEQRAETFPPINPEGWVQARNYASEDYNQVLNDFIKEREASLNWLYSLEKPNWDNEGIHTEYGKMNAGFFLNNWLAHDYLHIRQILALQYAYLDAHNESELSYAGGW